MRTTRTAHQIVERDEDIPQKPEFQIGDYVEVYSGRNEGHHFWIKDIRFNYDHGQFEYLYGVPLLGGWHLENQVVRLEKKKKMDDET